MAKKKVDKLVRFLETIPCFTEQPRNNLEYFSKQMQKIYFKRNEILYKKGQSASHVYIVKKGDFEVTQPLQKNFSKLTTNIIDLLGFDGIDENRKNQLGKKLPEICKNAPHDLPSNLRLYSHQ